MLALCSHNAFYAFYRFTGFYGKAALRCAVK